VSSAAPEYDLILGRYRALRPLGSGGMGQVWLARDEQSGLDLALKIVPREGKSGSRAEREARAAASLRHPRCQRIISLARDPSHVYIAYEYVPGRTLREAIRAGELKDSDAVEVAAQICEALAHAHGKGIVHRDVKPSNVLLAETAAVDVTLLDFGLAQMAEFDTLTALGDIPGTLAYIAPERLHGRAATPAADVWAVGVVLWEALAGEHPFWGGDLVETSRRIQAGAPGLETRRPDLPDHLLRTVARSLVINPQRRPSARELADELRALPKRRKGKQRTTAAATPQGLPALANRLVPGALAGLASGWVAARLAFYPNGWPLMLAGAGAALGFTWPRAGLAFALATAFFPLANVSLGLALLYAALAVVWLATRAPACCSPRGRCSPRSPRSRWCRWPRSTREAALGGPRTRAPPCCSRPSSPGSAACRCPSTARRPRSGSASRGRTVRPPSRMPWSPSSRRIPR